MSAVESTIDSLAETPGIGAAWVSEHPMLQSIRKHAVAGFPKITCSSIASTIN